MLRCPHCGADRPFLRPPLLIVTGTAGIGKSTLCARLAGTIPGAVILDADILADDLVSVASPNHDYPAFWRSMMRLAHELAQNNLVVVYFSVMMPDQALANSDVVGYFDSVDFLCLTCPPDALQARLNAREASEVPTDRVAVWTEFDRDLAAAAETVQSATILDAGRPADLVERDVRHWIDSRLIRERPVATDPPA